MNKQRNSSWEGAAKWYDQSVGEKGHYYHQEVIVPGLLRLMDIEKAKEPKVLDLGCGQGIFARHLPSHIPYLGLDLSQTLIKSAKQRSNHEFQVADVTKKLSLPSDFSHAAIILALQNMEEPKGVLKNARAALRHGGKLYIVLNHPCFRIPRQSSWGYDEEKKIQYRRVDRYLSPMQIPIQTHPGKPDRGETMSYHLSLTDYSKALFETGFVIEQMEEWISNKKSEGGRAKIEDTAREEFPLFITLVCAAL